MMLCYEDENGVQEHHITTQCGKLLVKILFMKQIIIIAEFLLRYEDKNQSVVT